MYKRQVVAVLGLPVVVASLPSRTGCDEAERCLLVEVRVAKVAPPRSERKVVKDIAIGLYIYRLVVAVLGLPAGVVPLPSQRGCEVRVAEVAPPRSKRETFS